MTICMCYHISGKVQGVSYRASAQREARRLGLRGYACNLADGRVEVVACGSAENLGQFEQWLQRGPALAEVHAVQPEPLEPAPYPDPFTMR